MNSFYIGRSGWKLAHSLMSQRAISEIFATLGLTMSRKHIWYYLRNQNGRPIKGASLKLYLAGTKTLATIYNIPTSGADDEIDQSTWTTNPSGLLEFFIGDFTETTKVGYTADQNFDFQWVASAGSPPPSGILYDRGRLYREGLTNFGLLEVGGELHCAPTAL